MKDTGKSSMVRLFLTSYDDFKARLRRRLGSEDLANDVLHETYLRVDRMEEPPNIAQPNAYLYRMALNIAADRRQSDARLLTGTEVEELLQVSDEALDPARVVGGQKEIQLLLHALYELPARRRKIFIAARLEEAPHLEISQRFGISTRMVEKEIKAALNHCAGRLERKVIQRFGPGAGKPS
ncbi:RNA polymerase sigma factor [Pseudomonas sp. PB120]|uniref:RNA polymerase sigma factor n=1 Tax=Pseudomonas sp. PB120 TaxID=2494700 RepID=UPI0012FE30DB|nr:RNA polymerase sigma factor [Pseudomonas sp. PB120]MVV47949.1 RNA polymerase sigma factor [Pseudomonas sp. PB120]